MKYFIMKKTTKVILSPVTGHLYECYQEKVRCAATVRSTEQCKTLHDMGMESKRQWELGAVRSSYILHLHGLSTLDKSGMLTRDRMQPTRRKDTREQAGEAHHWGFKTELLGKGCTAE